MKARIAAISSLALLGCAGAWYMSQGKAPALIGVNEAAEPSVPTDKASWPRWRGPNNDGVSTEAATIAAWGGKGPTELWRVDGGGGYSTFAIAAGRVITLVSRGDVEIVLALDAVTGKELWSVKSDADREDGFGSGPRSTPTIDGKHVYTLGANGTLMCLDVSNGREVWKTNILKQFNADNLRWGVSTSPLVEGDLLLVNAGGAGASMVAFNKTDGKVVWKVEDDGAGYASPIAITVGGVRNVVFFTAAGLVGLDPKSGSLHWRIAWQTQYDANIASPVWVESTRMLVVSSGYDRGCAGIRLAAVDLKVRAEKVWENRELKSHQATPVLVNGKLYGFDGNGPAVLKCIDPATGDRLWVNRSVGKGSLTAVGDTLVVFSERGDLALVAADPAAYREKARFKPFNGKCWAVPVYTGGRLYLRDEREIVCIELK